MSDEDRVREGDLLRGPGSALGAGLVGRWASLGDQVCSGDGLPMVQEFGRDQPCGDGEASLATRARYEVDPAFLGHIRRERSFHLELPS